MLCASVDVKLWKPVHVKLLTFIHSWFGSVAANDWKYQLRVRSTSKTLDKRDGVGFISQADVAISSDFCFVFLFLITYN